MAKTVKKDELKRKIIFRADAGQNIGYGHFIRSLALADMLQNDFDILFATVNPTGYQIAEMAKVCPYISLHQKTHYEDFLSLLQGDEIVLLDNYFFTTDYQIAIKQKGCKLVCIADLHDRHYVADLIIVQGQVAKSLYSIEPYTRFCIGLDWVLLRNPFIEAAKKNTSRTYSSAITNIVIAFGGADMYNLTGKTILTLSHHKNINKIDVIVGDAFKTQDYHIENVELNFHKNISAEQIVSFFFACDLAILPCSTVCLEALACKTRIAAGFYVDNQEEFYHYLHREQIVYSLGNFLDDEYVSQLDDLIATNTLPTLNHFPVRLNNLKERYIDVFNKL
ncbi:MAG: UDP-2,4-diacetamido-2,4,6-trideoxy-beta-L-altropyranose hydrolase [Prevotellaceae bacterium]|jgi:UDP-2,4-diacetamido-2,4,6-trideoxy-beta-L-altropyranose hydrolase|nr:UDP-2,4-diacetamido-2,4,6-trideoxy-beta-L-altropyranose hydrolase [Prevotellaceae bacterium]